MAGGAIFNIANLLLVAAIDIAGLAVAFPIGIGLRWLSAPSVVTSSRLREISSPLWRHRARRGGYRLRRHSLQAAQNRTRGHESSRHRH